MRTQREQSLMDAARETAQKQLDVSQCILTLLDAIDHETARADKAEEELKHSVCPVMCPFLLKMQGVPNA